MSKTKEQAAFEAAVKKAGIETANVWLQGAIKATPDQAGTNLEMLRHSCTFFLATYAVNKSKPECYNPPVNIFNSIMEIKETIEEYADMINGGIDNKKNVQFVLAGEDNAKEMGQE